MYGNLKVSHVNKRIWNLKWKKMKNILYLCEIKEGYRLVVSKTQECER